MKTKIILSVICSAITAVPVMAAPQKDISAALEREILQAPVTQATPLETFKQKIKSVTQPNTAALLEILPILTAYNADFESKHDSAKRALAVQLEGPIAVPWNTYRGNGLKEIFDNYVPNSHGNKALADLEYYVKFYTLPQKTVNRTYIVSKTLPDDFTNAYDRLKQNIATAGKRNNKDLVKQMAAFVPAYNALAAQEPVIAKELTSSLFEMPIKTGWDRTFSLKELALQIGVDYYSEGYNVRSAEQLMHQFGVDYTEAETVESFVRAL